MASASSPIGDATYQLALERSIGTRPRVINVLTWLGGLSIAFGVVTSFVHMTSIALSIVGLFTSLAFEGALLLMVRNGGSAARKGYVAYHAIGILLTLLVFATFEKSAGDAPVFTAVCGFLGLSVSTAIIATTLRPELSAWLRDVQRRRESLPAEQRRALVKRTVLFTLTWALAPLFIMKGVVKSTHSLEDMVTVVVFTLPIVVTGVIALAVQGWKLLKLRDE